jgi:hypothetical protein
LNLKSVQNKKVLNPYFKKYNQVFDLSLKILKEEFANVGESKSDFSAFQNKNEFSIPNGIYVNYIYPDVIIDYGNNEIGVYDVKYKNYDFINGVKREDRFQIITYVATHLNKYKVIDCGIIYPLRESDFEKSKSLKQQTLRIDKKEISFNIILYKVCKDFKNQTKIDEVFMNDNKPSP